MTFALLLPITSRGAGGLGTRPAHAVEDSLKGFAQSVLSTTSDDDSEMSMIEVFVGVDEGDPVLDTANGDGIIDRVFKSAGTASRTIVCKVQQQCDTANPGGVPQPQVASAKKGQVCEVWRQLAKAAYQAGAEYTVLLGDDVRLTTPGWTTEVRNEFVALHREAWASDCASYSAAGETPPVGLGVVAFTDSSSPGFPGFPVLHRTHAEIFPDIFPEDFVNQDADPWIFEVYLRFGAAKLMPNARLTNTMGGCRGEGDPTSRKGPRYLACGIDWKSKLLADGVGQVRSWIESRPLRSPESTRRLPGRFVTLDVLVPSFRLDMVILRGICSLDVPVYMRTKFIIIVDNPDTTAEEMTELKAQLRLAAGNNICRVRQNEINFGAGPSRNCALRETSADWALFLDDDVIPSTNLLHAYGRHILERTAAIVNGNGNDNVRRFNGNGTVVKDTTTDSLDPAPAPAFGPDTATTTTAAAAATATAAATTTAVCGFIGKTKFPPATSWLLHSVVLSDVTYMYGISDALPFPAWGPTANVMIRVAAEPGVGGRGGTRSTVEFGDTFPKTGGGEDVDFCLRFEHERGGTFAAAPDAIVTHPWWPGGRITTFRRFFRWSSGDGQLFDLHEEHCYYTAPNVAESTILAPVLTIFLLSLDHWSSHLQWSPRLPGITVTSTSAVAVVLSAPLVVLASEMIYDVARNLNKYRAKERLPEVHGVARMFAAAGASCVIATLEMGRLAGHWKRGGLTAVCKNFCRRFDWHCGRQNGVVQWEKHRALRKVVLHLGYFVAVASVLLESSKRM